MQFNRQVRGKTEYFSIFVVYKIHFGKESEQVRSFVPAFHYIYIINPDNPSAYGEITTQSFYSYGIRRAVNVRKAPAPRIQERFILLPLVATISKSIVMKKLLLLLICTIAIVCQARTQNRVAHEYRYKQSSHYSANDNRSIPFTNADLTGKSVYYIFDVANKRCYEVQRDGSYDPNAYFSLDYEEDGIYSFSNSSTVDMFLGMAAEDPATILGDFCYIYNDFTTLQIYRTDEDGYDCSDFYIRTGGPITARATESY